MRLRYLSLIVIAALCGCSTQGITEPTAPAAGDPPSQPQRGTYKWVDKDGIIHQGDRIPLEYLPPPDRVPRNVEEAAAEQLVRLNEMRRRTDVFWQKCDPDLQIHMSCGECAHGVTAQLRVIELYLAHFERRRVSLESRDECCVPSNSDPDAPMNEGALAKEILETKEWLVGQKEDLRKLSLVCLHSLPPGSQTIAQVDDLRQNPLRSPTELQ